MSAKYTSVRVWARTWEAWEALQKVRRDLQAAELELGQVAAVQSFSECVNLAFGAWVVRELKQACDKLEAIRNKRNEY